MRVRVATLNTWALPGLARQVGERIHAIGQHLTTLGADVVAFQEVWTAGARRQLEAAGREAGLGHAFHAGTPRGGGLLVVSRLPFDEPRFERFALTGLPERIDHADYYGGKGFTSLRLRTDAGPVTLLNTHLHARYSSDVPHEYRPHRTGEIVEIALAARETDDPIVAVGDFNFEVQQPEYAVFTGLTGMRDAAAEHGRPANTVWAGNAYRGAHNKGKRVDYVFVRDGRTRGLATRAVQLAFDESIEISGRPASYSNHAGVLAEIEVLPQGAPLAPPKREAIAAASRMLREGTADAQQRRRNGRTWAGLGFGAAAVATFGTRTVPLTRRRMLRLFGQGATLAALTPGVGFSILSEVFVPDELRAIEHLANRLDRLDQQLESGDLVA